jgi:AcrR family transcriptional regulator
MTVMTAASLQDVRAAVVRDRVMEGVARLLAAGDDLTFAKVAAEAAVPERTVYRHFPTREALLAGVYAWANQRIGFDGQVPTSSVEATALVRRVFPGFDEIAPVIRELLIAPEARPARLSSAAERRRVALAMVDNEVPDLDQATRRRLAAALQLMTTAGTWQTLRDYWGMDGDEAAETAALAIDLLVRGARARRRRPPIDQP